MRPYSKRTATFIRKLAGEMPMNKIDELLHDTFEKHIWGIDDGDFSTREQRVAEQLGYDDREIDGLLDARGSQLVEHAKTARKGHEEALELWSIDRDKIRLLERQVDEYEKVLRGHGLIPAEVTKDKP